MPEPRHPVGLAARTTLAFAAVAVLAVASLATVILLATRSETQTLTNQERQATLASISAELARSYARAGSWQRTNLSAATALATRADAVLLVTDQTGATVLDTRPLASAGSGRFSGGQGRGPGAGGPPPGRDPLPAVAARALDGSPQPSLLGARAWGPPSCASPAPCLQPSASWAPR